MTAFPIFHDNNSMHAARANETLCLADERVPSYSTHELKRSAQRKENSDAPTTSDVLQPFSVKCVATDSACSCCTFERQDAVSLPEYIDALSGDDVVRAIRLTSSPS